MTKVVYVSMGRLTDKVARDWYIDFLTEQGVLVEYWDVVALLREEHAERGELTRHFLHVVSTFGELEKKLQMADHDVLYVLLIPYHGQFTRIYRLFSKHACRMLFIAWGALPGARVLGWRRLAAVWRNPAWYLRELFCRCKAGVLRKLNLVKPFEVVFAAGRALTVLPHHATRVVPINLCDYDNYVRARDDTHRLVTGRYAVFLDINLPYHSDLVMGGYPMIDPTSYYRSLNLFFDRLAEQYGMRVVIAAHPKATYDAETFAGRGIHRLVTAELVRDAELVLCHTSTALSYAVLNTKPVIFIYTQAMDAVYRDTLIRRMYAMAGYLGTPILNVDTLTPGVPIRIASANIERYVKYKYDFLTTPESEHTSTREILLQEILRSARGRPCASTASH